MYAKATYTGRYVVAVYDIDADELQAFTLFANVERPVKRPDHTAWLALTPERAAEIAEFAAQHGKPVVMHPTNKEA
jgi:hypothetical protein